MHIYWIIVQQVFTITLFVLVLALIGADLINRMAAALLAAALLISLGIVGQHAAATEFIDWNTIGLLVGTMVIVSILDKTGIFEYLAIKSAQLGRARPGRILILLGADRRDMCC